LTFFARSNVIFTLVFISSIFVGLICISISEAVMLKPSSS
jgi:hypothetical protein